MPAWRAIRPVAFEPSQELQARLLRRAQALCRGTFDAEDLLQDVLTAFVARSRNGPIVPERSIEALLFISLKNAFISRLRHQQVEQRFEDHQPPEEPSEQAPPDLPEVAPWQKVTDEELAQAIESLSRKQREVFLAVTRGERYVEVADRLGIAPGAVGKRVFDARRKLRKRLQATLARRRSP